MSIYLDNAATTRVCDEAAAAALAIMTDNYGNPSSTHAAGRQARGALQHAREQGVRRSGLQAGGAFLHVLRDGEQQLGPLFGRCG
jgi:cysteine desulfurase